MGHLMPHKKINIRDLGGSTLKWLNAFINALTYQPFLRNPDIGLLFI